MNNNPHNPPNLEWMDLRRLTQYAAVSERTIRSWIHAPLDPLPAVKVCGKYLVRKATFDRYLEGHRFKNLETVDVDGIVRDVLEGVADGRQGSKAER